MSKPSDYEKKLLEMQYHLKENNLYMEDTFKDLENWTKEMAVKEKKIIENPNLIKNENKVCLFLKTVCLGALFFTYNFHLKCKGSSADQSTCHN
jgi:hypothetical protein